MKRFFAFAGLMTAAAISLTNCQPKEIGVEQVPVSGKSFCITASTDGTKTTNNGMETLWEAIDTINVFFNNQASGFVSLGKATVQSGDGTKSAVFGGDVPASVSLPDGAATWYAFFPYIAKMEAPDGQSGFAYIGHSKGINQNGLGSMAHLRGNVCPMYGVAESNGPTASFTMKQLASVIEFNVKNGASSDIAVTSISFEASEDIVGSYYYDLTSSPVTYTSSGDNYVFKKAVVNIQGENTIAAGATGLAYLPIKPYTQASTAPIKVIVNFSVAGKASSCTIELNPTAAQGTFEAGKIKKVNLTVVEEQDEPGVTTVSTMMADYVEDHNCTVSTQSDKTVYSHLDLSDAVRLYTTGQPDCGTFWSPTAGTDWRLYQNKSGDVNVKVASGCSLKSVKITYSATNGGVLVSPDKQQLSSDDVYECTGNEVSFVVGNIGDATNGQVRITAIVVKYTGSGKLDEWVDPVASSLEVSPKTVNLAAAASNSTVTVTSDNAAWTVDNSATASWATVTKDGSSIKVSAAANTGEERSTKFTVKHATVSSLSVEVTVKQAAGTQTGGGTVSEVVAGSGQSVSDVTVTMVSGQNFFVSDNTGTILVRMGGVANLSGLNIKKGDKVDVSGNVTTGHGMIRFNHTNANNVTVTPKGTGSITLTPKTWTGSDVAAAYSSDDTVPANNPQYVTVSATYDGNNLYRVAGTDVVVFVQDKPSAVSAPAKGQDCTLTGFIYGWSLYNETKEVVMYAESIETSGTSTNIKYNKVTSITSGKKYLIVAANKNGSYYAATALASNKTYGRLNGTVVTVSGTTIEKAEDTDLEFTITSSGTGYTIAMGDGRLLAADSEHNGTFQIGDSYDHTFSITANTDGTFTIVHSQTSKTMYHGGGTYTNFSLVSSVPDDGLYPMLFQRQ